MLRIFENKCKQMNKQMLLKVYTLELFLIFSGKGNLN